MSLFKMGYLENGEAIYKELDLNNHAENWFIYGKQSSGKVEYVTRVVTELRKSDYKFTMMTDRANTPLRELEGVTILRSSQGDQRYFNPLYKFHLKDDIVGYKLMSTFFVKSVINTMIDYTYHGDDKEDVLISSDIFIGLTLDKHFNKIGIVNDNTETWYKSNELSLKTVYEMLISQLEIEVKTNPIKHALLNAYRYIEMFLNNEDYLDVDGVSNDNELDNLFNADCLLFIDDVVIDDTEGVIKSTLMEHFFIYLAYYRLLLHSKVNDIVILDDFSKNRLFKENLWLVKEILKQSQDNTCLVVVLASDLKKGIIECMDLFTDILLTNITPIDAMWLEEGLEGEYDLTEAYENQFVIGDITYIAKDTDVGVLKIINRKDD